MLFPDDIQVHLLLIFCIVYLWLIHALARALIGITGLIRPRILLENVFGLIKNMCWANTCDHLIGLLCITTPARTPVDEPVRTAQLLGLSILHDSELCASSDIVTNVPGQVMPDAPPFEKTAL